MSAGSFVRTVYQGDDAALLFPVRVQPETLALTVDGTANAAAAGSATEVVSAKVSGGRREIGVNCRKVRFTFTAAPPLGYAVGQTLSVPVLTPALYTSIAKGDTGTYLGAAIEVVGKTPEYIN